MNKKILSFCVFFSIILNITGWFFSASISIASEWEDENYADLPYVPWEVIVQYKQGKEHLSIKKVSELQKKGHLIQSTSLWKEIKNFHSKNKSTKELIQEFKNDTNVEFVQPNFIYKIQSTSPNDYYFWQQWALHNIGQTVNGNIWLQGIDIDWKKASNIFSGANIGTGSIIAVIDSGVSYFHDDLKNQMWNGENCLSDTGAILWWCIHGYNYYAGNKNPLDIDGHGTHVAGIIGAEINNSLWIAGVNPNSKIMAIKWIGAFGTTSDIVKSINFAKHNGAKIINASWGAYFLEDETCAVGSNPLFDLSLYNAIKDFQEVGGLLIAAAGNYAKNHDVVKNRFFPAWFSTDVNCGNLYLPGLDNIISVASHNNSGNISSFSDYGSESVHILAPGSSIVSTYLDNEYAYANGTSMAAPYVAGIASLAWWYRPNLNYLEIKEAILSSGDTLASLSGSTITGKKVNAFQTLLSLSEISNIEELKIYQDESKQAEIISLSSTGNIYLEWKDNTPENILSWYILKIDNENENIFSQNTKNTFFTGITIEKSGTYHFSLYKELINGNTGGLISLNNISFDLNPIWELHFLSGTHTNTQNTQIEIKSQSPWSYFLTGSLQESYSGLIHTGITLEVILESGEGKKDIVLELKDEFDNISILTGSIILDTTHPEFLELSLQHLDIFATGSIVFTWVVQEINLDTLHINNDLISVDETGYFSHNLLLHSGQNTIEIEAKDKAGNITKEILDILRVGRPPEIQTQFSFWKLQFHLSKEFIWTWVILYGTWDLNNTFTWWIQTTEILEISILPETTYYYRAYYTHDWFDSLYSNTGSITTPFFIESTLSWEHTLTGTTHIVDATNSGVTFTQTGILQIKNETGDVLTFDIENLHITTQSGSWDGGILPPTKVTGSGNFSVSWYSRLVGETYKIWSYTDSLIFSGGKVTVSISVWTEHNNKILKVYRSWDHQENFEFVSDCTVSNGICTFETNRFSYFTFFSANPVSSWGGWWIIQQNTCTTSQLECKNGVFELKSSQVCTGWDLGKICNKSNLVYPAKKIEKEIYVYKDFELVRYPSYQFSKKVETLAKIIIDYKKIDSDVKESFIHNLNNFLQARYEFFNATQKTTPLKNSYNKQVILLKNSIKKLDQNIKKNKKKK